MTIQEICNLCDVVQGDMQPMGSRSLDLNTARQGFNLLKDSSIWKFSKLQ